jgi:hypothetical protein
MENQDKKAVIEALKLEAQNQIDTNTINETLINHIYQQLGVIYQLQGVCLEILKDLEHKKELNQKEQYWFNELVTVLFESEGI